MNAPAVGEGPLAPRPTKISHRVGSSTTMVRLRCAEDYVIAWGAHGEDDANHKPRPKDLMRDIGEWQVNLGICIHEHLRPTKKVNGVQNGGTLYGVEMLIVDEAKRFARPIARLPSRESSLRTGWRARSCLRV